MDDIRLVLKENLRLYRKRKGLTQQRFAEACGVSTSYVGEMEIGRKYPSLPLVQTMAEILEIAPWKLFLPARDRESAVTILLADELRDSIGQAVLAALQPKS
jgi:transcriptional regulator with XRE-family HTH domain